MISGFWGKKVGMTQLFSDNKVVPATVIDVSAWYVTDIKTQERDGYHAVQVGQVRKRYAKEQFSPAWLKDKRAYFIFVREVRVSKAIEGIEVGQTANFAFDFAEGDLVSVTGLTKGCGFAGVVKRHDYAGAKGSHGNKMGRRPGSIGYLRTSGFVMKGKALPGHMGVNKRTMQNLELIKILKDDNAVVVKGSVPGKAGSLVFVRKGDA